MKFFGEIVADEDIVTKKYVDEKVAAAETTKIYRASDTDFAPLIEAKVDYDGVTYNLYKFLLRTAALPNTTSKEYDLSTLMADYTIMEFTSVQGFAANGHRLSSGRTDSTNGVCVIQQVSKNRKTVTLRTYSDLTAQTALLEIEFIGRKAV